MAYLKLRPNDLNQSKQARLGKMKQIMN